MRRASAAAPGSGLGVAHGTKTLLEAASASESDDDDEEWESDDEEGDDDDGELRVTVNLRWHSTTSRCV